MVRVWVDGRGRSCPTIPPSVCFWKKRTPSDSVPTCRGERSVIGPLLSLSPSLQIFPRRCCQRRSGANSRCQRVSWSGVPVVGLGSEFLWEFGADAVAVLLAVAVRSTATFVVIALRSSVGAGETEVACGLDVHGLPQLSEPGGHATHLTVLGKHPCQLYHHGNRGWWLETLRQEVFRPTQGEASGS